MKHDIPQVSILMVTYNRGLFLRDAIESVLSQGFSDWELILIDDGSTDHTKEIAQTYVTDERIRYVPHAQNVGIVTSRNEALHLARGEYIAVLDSDDVWCDSEKLEKQVQFLNTHPEYTVVGCTIVDIVDSHGKSVGQIRNPETDTDIRHICLSRNPFVHSSVLYRRHVAMAHGGYMAYVVGEDYDLLLYMGTQGKMHNMPFRGVLYRRHGANISRTHIQKALRLNIQIMHAYALHYPNVCFARMRRYLRYMIGMVCFK